MLTNAVLTRAVLKKNATRLGVAALAVGLGCALSGCKSTTVTVNDSTVVGGSDSPSAPSSSAGAASSSGGGSSGAQSSGGGSTGDAVTVPATVSRTRDGAVTVLVRATIKKKPYYFVLDSGASRTVVDVRIAKAAGLRPAGATTKTKTIGCTSTAQPFAIDDWSLGSKALPAGVVSGQRTDNGDKKYKGVPIAGLLGADVQAAAGLVTVDYRSAKVTLGGPAPSGGTQVKLKVVQQKGEVVAVAPVTIHGTKGVMQVDTGASKTTIGKKYVTQFMLPKAGKAMQISAVGCPATIQPVTLDDAAIGDKDLPKAVVAGTAVGSPLDPAIIGLFGSDLMSSFGTITIDYRGSALTLGG